MRVINEEPQACMFQPGTLPVDWSIVSHLKSLNNYRKSRLTSTPVFCGNKAISSEPGNHPPPQRWMHGRACLHRGKKKQFLSARFWKFLDFKFVVCYWLKSSLQNGSVVLTLQFVVVLCLVQVILVWYPSAHFFFIYVWFCRRWVPPVMVESFRAQSTACRMPQSTLLHPLAGYQGSFDIEQCEKMCIGK